MKLNTEEIKKLIPHRDPFLFIDEVVSIEEGDSIHAVLFVKHDCIALL